MFDIGFSEILVVATLTLIVMGPKRLPEALRTLALWIGRAREKYREIKSDLENEIGMDDIRNQLHNENILRSLKEADLEIKNTVHTISQTTSITEPDRDSSDEPPKRNSVTDDATSNNPTNSQANSSHTDPRSLDDHKQ